MTTLRVNFQAMCANKIGVYLCARTRNSSIFSGPPIAQFKSISAMHEACERAGVACTEWGGPDSRIAWELSPEQLRDLGFRLRVSVLEWIAMSSPAGMGGKEAAGEVLPEASMHPAGFVRGRRSSL